jgi:hypothetical protein
VVQHEICMVSHMVFFIFYLYRAFQLYWIKYVDYVYATTKCNFLLEDISMALSYFLNSVMIWAKLIWKLLMTNDMSTSSWYSVISLLAELTD